MYYTKIKLSMWVKAHFIFANGITFFSKLKIVQSIIFHLRFDYLFENKLIWFRSSTFRNNRLQFSSILFRLLICFSTREYPILHCTTKPTWSNQKHIQISLKIIMCKIIIRKKRSIPHYINKISDKQLFKKILF